jgi:hypothetical protein
MRILLRDWLSGTHRRSLHVFVDGFFNMLIFNILLVLVIFVLLHLLFINFRIMASFKFLSFLLKFVFKLSTSNGKSLSQSHIFNFYINFKCFSFVRAFSSRLRTVPLLFEQLWLFRLQFVCRTLRWLGRWVVKLISFTGLLFVNGFSLFLLFLFLYIVIVVKHSVFHWPSFKLLQVILGNKLFFLRWNLRFV